jgi:hypothetical protein
MTANEQNQLPDQQLELGFNGMQSRIYGRPRTRVTRAKWWFAKMRAAVENTMNWQNEAAPRSEQIWMPGANREVKI